MERLAERKFKAQVINTRAFSVQLILVVRLVCYELHQCPTLFLKELVVNKAIVSPGQRVNNEQGEGGSLALHSTDARPYHFSSIKSFKSS